MPKAPGGLAPPIPGGGNRVRSNSDQTSRDSGGVSGMEQPPQLAGLFAGGMPKLKKRGGGVDTGGELSRLRIMRSFLIANSESRVIIHIRPGVLYKFCTQTTNHGSAKTTNCSTP
jgi:hypothetical protein